MGRGESFGEVIHRSFEDRIEQGELDFNAARLEQERNTYRDTGKRVGQEGIEAVGASGKVFFENGAEALRWVNSTGGLILTKEGDILVGRKVKDIFDDIEKNKKLEA